MVITPCIIMQCIQSFTLCVCVLLLSHVSIQCEYTVLHVLVTCGFNITTYTGVYTWLTVYYSANVALTLSHPQIMSSFSQCPLN